MPPGCACVRPLARARSRDMAAALTAGKGGSTTYGMKFEAAHSEATREKSSVLPPRAQTCKHLSLEPRRKLTVQIASEIHTLAEESNPAEVAAAALHMVCNTWGGTPQETRQEIAAAGTGHDATVRRHGTAGQPSPWGSGGGDCRGTPGSACVIPHPAGQRPADVPQPFSKEESLFSL
jgi:hypothetical protein